MNRQQQLLQSQPISEKDSPGEAYCTIEPDSSRQQSIQQQQQQQQQQQRAPTLLGKKFRWKDYPEVRYCLLLFNLGLSL
jgi:hypothetical protein